MCCEVQHGLDLAAEILRGEPRSPARVTCTDDRSPQQSHESKVVEVASLKRSVLPVISEAKKLALIFWNGLALPAHPA